MPKKKTKEEFIKEATEKHKGKYDYSKVEYVNNKTKVCIICSNPEHGEFWQSPSVHLRSGGCPKCGQIVRNDSKRLSKEEFIKKAREVHGDKYDYSKVEYVGALTKVCIICPEHGEFWQVPSSHLNGNGCPKCGHKTPLIEDFVKKSKRKHGNKYDYSKAVYVDWKTKVCIICPEHGEFWQKLNDHTNGQGCPTCAHEANGERKRLSKEEFIKKAREVHGDKYDYSKVEYVGTFKKVCIICHDHDDFWQIPSSHLQGVGCPKCNLSHLERSVMNYLDDVGITYECQKRFDWLGLQSLDFYLPDYNVGVECQGEQHFFPVDFAGKGVEWACKQFDKLISRDKRKKALCEEHGIKLLYFGKTPNYDAFLGEVVHDDVQYLIDYLNEHKKQNRLLTVK